MRTWNWVASRAIWAIRDVRLSADFRFCSNKKLRRLYSTSVIMFWQLLSINSPRNGFKVLHLCSFLQYNFVNPLVEKQLQCPTVIRGVMCKIFGVSFDPACHLNHAYLLTYHLDRSSCQPLLRSYMWLCTNLLMSARIRSNNGHFSPVPHQ